MTRFALRLGAAASIVALAAAPALARPMEIDDLAEIERAAELALSPDGETIAYTLSAPRDVMAGEPDGLARTSIYVIRGDGVPERFVGGDAPISGLQFSPDGAKLHFVSQRGEAEVNSLYEIALVGGESREVFTHSASIGDYAVSPDGATLYFVATDKADPMEQTLAEKGFNARLYEEGAKFAHLWKVALGEQDAEAEKLFEGGHVSDIELGPRGERLVAAVAPTPLVDDALMMRRVRVIDTASGEVTAEIDNPGKLGNFDISPDGGRLAFRGGTDIHDPSDGVLMVADLETGEFSQLTPEAEQHVRDVDWVGGDDILALVHRGVETELVIYDADNGRARATPTPPDIAIRTVAAHPRTPVVFTADSASHPNEVFRRQGRVTRKLTDHNGWLDAITLAAQTTYTYTARDGREIEGLLITPDGEAPEAGWPMILVVHGGPEAHYSDGWLTYYSTAGQIAAGRGYAVFYPNYRGSTGRGVAFTKEHQDDYAGKEFNDLVDGVEALAEDGLIDRARVGITGGSYGGYASMWGATALSEHFAASVAFVGISNQVSKFGTGDIPNEMHLVHSRRWPWEDNWMNLMERSPVFHAGNATTPTLILHGDLDTRVHPSQSLELYRNMKIRTDTPVRLIFYPMEGHGNRMAAAQMDYAHRLMRWMDHYLADGESRDKPMPDFDLGLADKLGLEAEAETAAASEADSMP